jgi:hypothetical protein
MEVVSMAATAGGSSIATADGFSVSENYDNVSGAAGGWQQQRQQQQQPGAAHDSGGVWGDDRQDEGRDGAASPEQLAEVRRRKKQETLVIRLAQQAIDPDDGSSPTGWGGSDGDGDGDGGGDGGDSGGGVGERESPDPLIEVAWPVQPSADHHQTVQLYMTELQQVLSKEELTEFAILLRAYRQRMPLDQYLRKLMVLFGDGRMYMLAGMRPFIPPDSAQRFDLFVSEQVPRKKMYRPSDLAASQRLARSPAAMSRRTAHLVASDRRHHRPAIPAAPFSSPLAATS